MSQHPKEEWHKEEWHADLEDLALTIPDPNQAFYNLPVLKGFISRIETFAYERGLREGREEEIKVIDEEIADWMQGEYHTNIAGGAIAALGHLKTLFSPNPKRGGHEKKGGAGSNRVYLD